MNTVKCCYTIFANGGNKTDKKTKKNIEFNLYLNGE